MPKEAEAFAELTTMASLDTGAVVEWQPVKSGARYPLDGRTGLLVRAGTKPATLSFARVRTDVTHDVDVAAGAQVVVAGLSRPEFHADGVGVTFTTSAPVDVAIFRL